MGERHNEDELRMNERIPRIKEEVDVHNHIENQDHALDDQVFAGEIGLSHDIDCDKCYKYLNNLNVEC